MVGSLGGAVSISARILTPFNLPHHCSWVSAFSFFFVANGEWENSAVF